VAGMALGDIFAWQAWHLRHWAGSGDAPGSQMPLALGDIDCHFAWQAWHLATWTFTLRGRRGAWRHVSSLSDIDAHFEWQAWHLRHWVVTRRVPK